MENNTPLIHPHPYTAKQLKPAETFARGHLQPGETLICWDRVNFDTGCGFISIIFGLLITIIPIAYIFDIFISGSVLKGEEIVGIVVFSVIGIFLTYVGHRCIFHIPRSYVFVTDKRLFARIKYMFKTKEWDIPIDKLLMPYVWELGGSPTKYYLSIAALGYEGIRFESYNYELMIQAIKNNPNYLGDIDDDDEDDFYFDDDDEA